MENGREVLSAIRHNLDDLYKEWQVSHNLCRKLLTQFRTLIASAHLHAMELENELRRTALQVEVARQKKVPDQIKDFYKRQLQLQHDLEIFKRELKLAEHHFISFKKDRILNYDDALPIKR